MSPNPFFGQYLGRNPTAERNIPKVWPPFVIKKRRPKEDNHPMGKNSPNLVTLLPRKKMEDWQLVLSMQH
jgi:hypothetical protein